MALPSSGAISIRDVNAELSGNVVGPFQPGQDPNLFTRSLGEASTRTLFGVPSGAISLSQGYGKANQFAFTISANQANANLRTLAVNAGWNQSSKVIATIASGVFVSANSTSVPALTVNGSFPGGVDLINNGFIVGMGGAGGTGRSTSGGGSAGASGGLSLTAQVPIVITNNGTIGGGGGGGGGGAAFSESYDNGKFQVTAYYGGGGGGGGRTGATNSAGGGYGVGNPSQQAYTWGKVGAAGTASAAGVGGNGATNTSVGKGGNGGNWGGSGATGYFGGGSPGAAVQGNSNITWVTTGTRLGAIT